MFISINHTDLHAKQGRVEACSTLCRIFCGEKFFEKLYYSILFGLNGGITDSCLPVILMNTISLFVEGVIMMVHDFVVGIMILPKLAPGFETDIPLENLRLAAIKIASTIMCLLNKVSLKTN